MFLDSVKVYLKAGKGGDGAVCFLHEKYIEKGGPSGGHGGRGGNVVFVGEEGLTTLIDFRFRKKLIAQDGQKGMDSNMTGKTGEDIYVSVPIGTVVIDDATGKILGDITKHKQSIIVCKGGRGGKGNAAYASPKNTTPAFAEKGLKGEEFNVTLELKLLADVGIIGFPSVGKSTLISVVSAAKPKIASYHFTTLSPNLGVVRVPDGRSFVMADMPGLIEGAHLGAGLGIEFLKHIERTRVLVHLIDMSATDGRNPIDDYVAIRKELGGFKEELLSKREIIVANKMDLPQSYDNLDLFKKAYPDKEIICISAYTKDNISNLLYVIADELDKARKEKDYFIDTNEVVEYTFKKQTEKFTITTNTDGFFVVEGPEIERLFERTNFDNEISVRQFARALRELGVDDKLRELGAEPGETILILGYEFEFIA